MTGVASESPHSAPLPTLTAHYHGASRDERLPFGRSDDLTTRQVINRRRSGDDDTSGNHGALLDHRACVDPRIAAHQHVVFDNDRQRANRLDDAANLRGGAQVHALADLRARSDERVRIDQRAFTDVRADVDVHRRHADDRAVDERAFANRGSAWHDANAGVESRLLQLHRVFVVERPFAVVGGYVDGVAKPEAEQNSLLHPGVDAPSRRRRLVRLRGARFAGGQQPLQFKEGVSRR